MFSTNLFFKVREGERELGLTLASTEEEEAGNAEIKSTTSFVVVLVDAILILKREQITNKNTL